MSRASACARFCLIRALTSQAVSDAFGRRKGIAARRPQTQFDKDDHTDLYTVRSSDVCVVRLFASCNHTASTSCVYCVIFVSHSCAYCVTVVSRSCAYPVLQLFHAPVPTVSRRLGGIAMQPRIPSEKNPTTQ